MHAPWICAIAGFGISSSRFDELDAVAPERAQQRGAAEAAELVDVDPGAEGRPSPRTITQ